MGPSARCICHLEKPWNEDELRGVGYFHTGNGTRVCNNPHELQVVSVFGWVCHQSNHGVLCGINKMVLATQIKTMLKLRKTKEISPKSKIEKNKNRKHETRYVKIQHC